MNSEEVRQICALLQKTLSVEFSGYRLMTIKRRLSRRLQLANSSTVKAYLLWR
jgi:chemotaxis methyl-accepting protein methylase